MKQITKFHNNFNKTLAIILVVFAIIYDISPVDLIPDIAIGIGQIDDIIATIVTVYNAWIQFKNRKN